MARLKLLVKLARQQEIDLFFGDETGFSLTPNVPYGWQPLGQQEKISTKREQLTNVLGFINPLTKQLISYATEKNEMINTSFMIRSLDDWAKGLKKETVLVLDNAPWHRSKAFKDRLNHWQQQGLYIFYLPAYCPHLNLIETLWRMIKCQWLRPQDYNSRSALSKRLKDIFILFGDTFTINFSLNIYT